LTDPTPEVLLQIEEADRQTETARARWLDPAWRTAALGWVEEQLARLRLTVTGAIEQPHLRPWSTALSVPTTGGRVWFKAGGPGNRYEAALLDALARWDTRGVLAPLAVDVDRGWLLLPDGGARLREAIDDGPGLDQWERVLGGWGRIQRELSPRAAELIAVGVPDRRPHVLARALIHLVDDPAVQLQGPDRARLRDLLPTYDRWCAELEAFGVPASLQHDDLHDGNVFVGPDGDRIFDWGDSSVSHPFGTLLVTFRSIAAHGLGGGAAERRALVRLRDAYLEPWTDAHSRASLTAAVPVAMRVAIVSRSLSWQGALAGIPVHDHGPWSGHVGGWLMELFEPTPL
jgi:hypothetical protein